MRDVSYIEHLRQLPVQLLDSNDNVVNPGDYVLMLDTYDKYLEAQYYGCKRESYAFDGRHRPEGEKCCLYFGYTVQESNVHVYELKGPLNALHTKFKDLYLLKGPQQMKNSEAVEEGFKKYVENYNIDNYLKLFWTPERHFFLAAKDLFGEYSFEDEKHAKLVEDFPKISVKNISGFALNCHPWFLESHDWARGWPSLDDTFGNNDKTDYGSFEWNKWYLKDFGLTLSRVLGTLIDGAVSDKNFRPIDEILIRSHAQNLMTNWLKKHHLKDDVIKELRWV